MHLPFWLARKFQRNISGRFANKGGGDTSALIFLHLYLLDGSIWKMLAKSNKIKPSFLCVVQIVKQSSLFGFSVVIVCFSFSFFQLYFYLLDVTGQEQILAKSLVGTGDLAYARSQNGQKMAVPSLNINLVEEFVDVSLSN